MLVVKKILKNLVKISTAIIIFISLAFLFICNALYSFSFSTESCFSKEKAADFLKSQEPSFKSASASKNKKIDFLEEGRKDIYIKSKDDLQLHAVYKENPKSQNKTVIVCHGYFGNFKSAQQYAKGFYNLGYSVLCPDLRAHGESEGNLIGMGYLEKDDILLWIDEILKINPNARIVLFGVSMGGATVLMAGGEKDIKDNVKAIISDCAYSSVYDEVDYIIKNITPLKSSALTRGMSFISLMRSGFSFKSASPLESVKKCKVPILFIHGNSDNFVPFSMLNELYENAECEKQKLIIKNASHGACVNKDPKLYWDTIDNFLKDHIEKS